MSIDMNEESLYSCGMQDFVRAIIVSIDMNEESLCCCRVQESCQSERPWGMSEVSLVTFSKGWKWTPEA